MAHTETLRPRLRRRRRADRPGDRPREERDLPHLRRRRPRHDGARHQDDARHAARRSVAPHLPDAAGARGADRAGRAGPEDEGGLLPQGRQGDPGARSGGARLPSARRHRSIPRSRRSSRIKNPGEKFAKLRAHPIIRRRSSCGRSSATSSTTARVHLAAIADNARDVDLAMRWGFGWAMGPFETWQAAGWKEVAGWIAEDIAAGQGAGERAAARVGRREVRRAAGVHTPAGRLQRRQRELPAALDAAGLRAAALSRSGAGREVAAPGRRSSRPTRVRMWHRATTSRIVSFKSKTNTIGEDVLDGVLAAIDEPSATARRWSSGRPREPFSLRRQPGVDRARACRRGSGRWSRASSPSSSRPSQRLKYSLIPTVAAVRGMALGGSCEFIMHCDRTVAALESYIGLVEVGVGLLPAGGGCKEFAVRAAHEVARGAQWQPDRPVPVPAHVLSDRRDGDGVARARCEAKELGYLRDRRRRRLQRPRAAVRREGARRARWRKPATGRRCRRATFPSPARPASRRWR